MLFIEFFTGGMLWFLVAYFLTKDWDSKELKTELIRLSPAVVYGVYHVAYVGYTVSYKAEGTLVLLAILMDLVTLPIAIAMGVFLVPTRLGNYALSSIGISELYEGNFIEVGFVRHFQS